MKGKCIKNHHWKTEYIWRKSIQYYLTAIINVVFAGDEIYKKFNTKHISYSHGTVVMNDIPEHRDVINDKLLAMLEEARAKFPVGLPEQGIPPLEPVAIDNFHFFIYQWAVIR